MSGRQSPNWTHGRVLFSEDVECIAILGDASLRHEVRYTLPVLWVAETVARWRAVWRCSDGDCVLEEGNEYNDFYGFATSIRYAMRDALKWVHDMELKRSDRLVCEVTAEVVAKPHDNRVGFTEKWQGEDWKKCLLWIPDGTRRIVQGPQQHRDFVFPVRERVETHTLRELGTIYTSARSRNRQQRAVEALREALKSEFTDNVKCVGGKYGVESPSL